MRIVVGLLDNRKDVEVYACRDNTAEVVVGVVAGDFASAADGVERNIAVAVKIYEFVRSLRIAFALTGNLICRNGETVGKSGVDAAGEDLILKFGNSHDRCLSFYVKN